MKLALHRENFPTNVVTQTWWRNYVLGFLRSCDRAK